MHVGAAEAEDGRNKSGELAGEFWRAHDGHRVRERDETEVGEHEYGEKQLLADRGRGEGGVFRGGARSVVVTAASVCHAR